MGRRLVQVSLALSLTVVVGALAAVVDIQPTSNASAGRLAASGTGTASCGPGLCAALSAASSASCTASNDPCVAVGGMGASCSLAAGPCLAVGGAGGAQGSVAVSALGPASSPPWCYGRYVPARVLVDLSSYAYYCGPAPAASAVGPSAGGVLAVSGAGDARADPACVYTNVFRGCYFGVAVSPAGRAYAPDGVPVGVAGSCNGIPCVAVGPIGSASGWWFASSLDGSAWAAMGPAVSAHGGSTSGLGPAISVTGPAASGSGPAVSATGDTYSGNAAASVTGDASGGVTVSGAGDSNGVVAVGLLGTCHAIACQDADPTGDASAYRAAASGTSSAQVHCTWLDVCVSASVLGPATARCSPDGSWGLGCTAVSVAQPARSEAHAVSVMSSSQGEVSATSALAPADAFVAVSGTDAASGIVVASGTGTTAGLVSVSGTGWAGGGAAGCWTFVCSDGATAVAVSGTNVAHARGWCLLVGCFGGIAVSGTGDALGGPVAVSLTEDATGAIAVSGTGHAHGWSGSSYSGCDTLSRQGITAACIDPA